MKYCHNCGSEVEETDKFCGNCAAPLNEPPPPAQSEIVYAPSYSAAAYTANYNTNAVYGDKPRAVVGYGGTPCAVIGSVCPVLALICVIYEHSFALYSTVYSALPSLLIIASPILLTVDAAHLRKSDGNRVGGGWYCAIWLLPIVFYCLRYALLKKGLWMIIFSAVYDLVVGSVIMIALFAGLIFFGSLFGA